MSAATPRCGNCGYDLTGAPSNRCPECGRLFIEAGVIVRRPRRRRWLRWVPLGVAALALPIAISMAVSAWQYRAALAARQAAMAAQARATQAFLQRTLAASQPGGASAHTNSDADESAADGPE